MCRQRQSDGDVPRPPDEDDPSLTDVPRARRKLGATPERDQDLVLKSPRRRTPNGPTKERGLLKTTNDDPLPP
jgi:hypothetical protein